MTGVSSCTSNRSHSSSHAMYLATRACASDKSNFNQYRISSLLMNGLLCRLGSSAPGDARLIWHRTSSIHALFLSHSGKCRAFLYVTICSSDLLAGAGCNAQWKRAPGMHVLGVLIAPSGKALSEFVVCFSSKQTSHQHPPIPLHHHCMQGIGHLNKEVGSK